MSRIHPADARDQVRIAAAVGYSIHFRKSPREAYNETADTLDEAKRVKAQLDATHGKHGRRAMIYAISASGASTPIP